MIDPFDITNYERTEYELQEFALFCIFVANKRADQTAIKLENFLENKNKSPFSYISFLIESGELEQRIKDCRLGQYNRISKALREIIKKDIKTITFEGLVAIPGIGPKTANFFLLHSRKGYEGVILDTHVLRHLRNKGIATPNSTPPYGNKYISLEKEFKDLWKKEDPETTLAEYDLKIWKKYSKSKINKA